ncbi:hypothetical protein FUAX_06890 [Fulvitalea axinellae]|uniref:Outer membrane protein beta-barrel domain-containing protein n=1 Tax=Fulvitalea axinellae TaxID=1182444 RepID=A0AAU9CSB6_9BACT|nr:hypothetical protein FUAX_06890 [Fulvitalea axinellae]
MKKLFFLSLLMLTVFSAQAQDYYGFGVKGGLNLSNLRGADGKMLPGFVGGIYFEYPLAEGFSVLSETVYSAQGAKADKENLPDLKLNYINWPILAKVALTEGLHLEAGPQMGFLVGGSGGRFKRSDYKTFDLAGSVGLSLDISHNVNIGARYNHGFLKVNKVGDELKNKNFQIALSISFW